MGEAGGATKPTKSSPVRPSKQADITSFFGSKSSDKSQHGVASSSQDKAVLPFTSKMRIRSSGGGIEPVQALTPTGSVEGDPSHAASLHASASENDFSADQSAVLKTSASFGGNEVEIEKSNSPVAGRRVAEPCSPGDDGANRVGQDLQPKTVETENSPNSLSKRKPNATSVTKPRKRLRRLADMDEEGDAQKDGASYLQNGVSCGSSESNAENEMVSDASSQHVKDVQKEESPNSIDGSGNIGSRRLESTALQQTCSEGASPGDHRSSDPNGDDEKCEECSKDLDELKDDLREDYCENSDRSNRDMDDSAQDLPFDLSGSASWSCGEPVPYKFVADTFARVEAITGRLEIQAILTDAFRKIVSTTPEDLLPVVYLCVNKLAPAHEGIEIGVGEGILLKALCQTTGTSIALLRSRYKEVGDLGDVASSARTTQKTMFPPPPLTARKVFSELRAIAKAAGKASQEIKKGIILKLLVASTSKNEVKFLARALQGKLRIHLADKTVLIALAAAFTLEKLGIGTGILLTVDGKKKAKLSAKEEEAERKLKAASNRLSGIYNQLPVWDIVIPALLECREINDVLAEKCVFLPGVPISPMLAKPTKAISEVLDRFSQSTFTCEYKYDGERAQVHRLRDGSVRVYSRNAENLTSKYPDLVTALPKALKDSLKDASFVLDAEAVAYDVERKMILPFQDLQSRKRKDVEEASLKVRVCVFAFDLLYFEGESLLLETFCKRREVLMSSFNEMEGVFMFAKGHDSRDPEEILELLNDSVKAGCEGLMVKALDGPHSTYEPANRSQNWLKVKKDYLEGLGDTLDLVPIGGYLGRGRRTGTYGGFLLACYDPENEEYQSICKIGTGFSDADFEKLSSMYNDESASLRSEFPKAYYRLSRNKNIEPDVWFEPTQVWEIKCADLSISPAHTAGIGKVEPSKGIALRFPRFIRVRDDKSPEDATTAEQVAELYSLQSSIANQSANVD